MDSLLSNLTREIIFWTAWIIIPLLIEILPAVLGFFILLKKSILNKKHKAPVRYPEITLIIPVYNSQNTLKSCLSSVYESEYPGDRINIILVNNGSSDKSFEVFQQCQKKFSKLDIRWLNAEQGKSKALNMALFSSKGKYVINIDSDGKLHPKALQNIIKRFEEDHEIHSMTAAILTDPVLIEKTRGLFLRFVRRCEFFEYCQAFLAGRNYQSEQGSIYTLSGACSAFRKSAILKTQLYNPETVSEDTHLTFQVRNLLNKSVTLCENAFFIVDPVDNLDKLYTQRQRWQRGEVEVSHMFFDKELNSPLAVLRSPTLRLLLFDHTFAFPRMIWYFALIFLVFLNYPLMLVFGSMVIIYLLYVFSAFLFFLNILAYLKPFREIRRYYKGKWYLIFFMPFFNFYTFFIRFAGIINSIKSKGSWKTATFTQEKAMFHKVIAHDMALFDRVLQQMKRRINHE